MLTCPHCRTESPVGTKLCPECGTEIPSPTVSRLNARGIDLVSLLSLVPYVIRAVWREFVAAWRKQGSWGKVILGLLVVTLLWCQLASMARLFLGAPSRVPSPTVTGRPRVMVAEEVATATPRPTYTVYATYTPYPTRPSPGSFASASPSLTITPKRALTPTSTPEPATPTSTPHCDLGAAFVRDVTIPDNTGIEPGTKFTKTWGLRNSGTCHWGDEVRLKHVDGERMAKSEWVSVPHTMTGESAEVSAEMQASKEVGTYKGAWRMCTEQGECFGDAVYVQIVVQAPTPTSAPTSTPKPTVPQPIVLQGSGQAATDAVALPAPISIARFTHTGSANFIVTVYEGDEPDLLINEIGPYQGARPLSGREPVIFDIDADGSWTVRIEPMGRADSAAFSGRGDAVSGLFDPPGMGPWQIKHNGQANFIVYSHCAGGSDLMQNEIGGVDGSRVVQFSQGPCFWEVQADGDWSLAPR